MQIRWLTRAAYAGVDRAISIVETRWRFTRGPIYVRHEVVHNRYVVDSLRERGAIFIEQISEVPDGGNPHLPRTASLRRTQRGESRDLTVFDATCPLVTKVHMGWRAPAVVVNINSDWSRWSPGS